MNAAKVTLTDAERETAWSLFDANGATAMEPYIESIVADRCAAAWDECHESGTPWANPYRSDEDA